MIERGDQILTLSRRRVKRGLSLLSHTSPRNYWTRLIAFSKVELRGIGLVKGSKKAVLIYREVKISRN